MHLLRRRPEGLFMNSSRWWSAGLVATCAVLAVVASGDRVGAEDGHAPPTGERVLSVGVEEADDSTRLVVQGLTRPTFTTYKQAAPRRLFVDLAGADVAGVPSPIDVDNGVIEAIVVEQLAGGVGRLSIGLRRDAGYDVDVVDGNVVIRVDGLGRTKGPTTAGQAPAELQRLEAEVRARLREEEARIMARRRDLEAAITESASGGAQVKAARAELAAIEADLASLKARRQEEERKLLALRAAVAGEEERRLAAEQAARKALDARQRAEAAGAGGVRDAALAEAALHEKEVAAAEAEARRIADKRDREIASRLGALEARVDAAEKRADVHAEAASAAVAAARRAREGQAAARATLTDVRFEDLADRSVVVIEADGRIEHQVGKSEGGRAVLRLLGVEVPRALERKLDTTAFPSPIVAVTSYGGDPKDGEARVVVELGEATDSRVRGQGRRLVWEFRKRGAAPAGWASDTEPGAPRRAPAIATRPAGAAAPAVGRVAAYTGVGAPTFAAVVNQQVGSGFGQAASAGASAPQRFTGKRITIDLKDADIHNVLRLLAKEGRINVIASEDVSGSITLHLERIPWDQAMDVILRTKGLTQRREGDIVWVTPLKILKEQEKIRVEVKKAQEELEPLEVRLITVNYAEGKAIVEQVKTVLSKRGSGTHDERTNTIVIKDIAEHADAAEDLVRRLDSQTALILIEARIVEASSTFSEQAGIQWGGDFARSPAFGNPTGLQFPNVVAVRGGADDSQANTNGTATTPNFAVNLPAAAGLGTGGSVGFIFGSVGDSANLNLRLSAAEENGSIKLLAAPRIATLDNSIARIRQGVSIPVAVISAQGVNTVFFDADLELRVTPHVTQDGNVVLDTVITKNTPDFANTGARGDPSIQRKEATSTMMVKDGDTAVIGGIYTKEDSVSVKKVPFFGDIPVIGALFRFTDTQKNRSELLMFLTPRIVNRSAAVVQGGKAAGAATFK